MPTCFSPNTNPLAISTGAKKLNYLTASRRSFIGPFSILHSDNEKSKVPNTSTHFSIPIHMHLTAHNEKMKPTACEGLSLAYFTILLVSHATLYATNAAAHLQIRNSDQGHWGCISGPVSTKCAPIHVFLDGLGFRHILSEQPIEGGFGLGNIQNAELTYDFDLSPKSQNINRKLRLVDT